MTDEQFRYIHRQLRTICIYLAVIFGVCLMTLCMADGGYTDKHGINWEWKSDPDCYTPFIDKEMLEKYDNDKFWIRNNLDEPKNKCSDLKADEPEIIDYGYSRNTPYFSFVGYDQPIIIVETSLNGKFFDVDKDSVKMSCPDGYVLKIKDSNRNTEHGWESMVSTDAELKCVKEYK